MGVQLRMRGVESSLLLFSLLFVCHPIVHAGDLSLYSYLVGDGVTSGLEANGDEFRVNGKELKILSGSLHYFRVHPQYWRTRLRQYKAAGLNTVDVYVPWNLHEPLEVGQSAMPSSLSLTRLRDARSS